MKVGDRLSIPTEAGGISVLITAIEGDDIHVDHPITGGGVLKHEDIEREGITIVDAPTEADRHLEMLKPFRSGGTFEEE